MICRSLQNDIRGVCDGKMQLTAKIFPKECANMEIKREYYLDKLIKRQNNGLIKVITGIRRCGKSYLLNTLFYNYLIESGIDKEHIIRFAFDSAEDLHLIGENLISVEKEKRGVNPELFMEYIRCQTSGEGKYYLLLDEVQLLDSSNALR